MRPPQHISWLDWLHVNCPTFVKRSCDATISRDPRIIAEINRERKALERRYQEAIRGAGK